MITDPLKHAEKEKALKKLIRKWLMAQDTQNKANLLLSRNPQIRRSGKPGKAV
ncbi:MAG TPA: hypothetical protein VG605_01945 [Puia sp.]|jgi:hypothetical protein|nr:hypothetical protein [Puia sp.]